MSEKPFVSIIIPFFNTPVKPFERCINSLINQTYKNFEAIIINDGSSEEYRYILKQIVNLDERIRVINKNNEGSAIARNVGINEAKGDYIMFLDSDDMLTEFCLEEAEQIVQTLHPDLVIGAVRRVTEEEIEQLNPLKCSNARIMNISSEQGRNSLMSHMIGSVDSSFSLETGYIGDGPVARLLKKTIAVESPFSCEAFWSDDTIWNTKMLKKCELISIIDDLWYKYLIYPYSKTRRFRPNCSYEFAYRTKQELELFKELWPNCMEGIYSRIFNDITLFCRTFLFHPDNPKPWKEKYDLYKECIHKEAYREALRGLNLKRERRVINRMGKEMLRFTAYYGPNIISYWILKFFYNLQKDKL